MPAQMHTPGPWKVNAARFDDGGVAYTVEAEGIVISKANADLIAAAPALLAALTDALAAPQFAANAQEKAGDLVGASETHAKLRAARAALALATGEAR